jgi:hypothetical protein
MAIRWGGLVGAVGAALASALVSTSSSAQTDGRPIRLEYDAAESCPSRDTFVAGLRARTDRFELTLADPRATTYRVTLRPGNESRAGDETTGQVESRDASGAQVVQKLHGTTCGEVANALALVLALAIDARANDARAFTAAPTPPPPLAPPAAPPEPPSDRFVGRTSRTSRWAVSSTLGVGVTGPFVGPEAFLEVSLVPATGDRRFSFVPGARLGASLGWSRAGDSFGDVAQFTRASALLDLCPLRLAWGRLVAFACARGEAGALTASGGSLQTTPRPSLAGGALVVARWTPWDRVFVQLEGGVVLPFPQDRFLLDGFAVYIVSPVEALGSVAVGARFR